MFPHVLEIYVVWHPNDTRGEDVRNEFVEHFHGSAYSGLLSGAIEVFGRSRGLVGSADVPRPIPFPGLPWPGGVEPARHVAIVPVLGNGLAGEAKSVERPWRRYLQAMADAQAATPLQCKVFPLFLDTASSSRDFLQTLFPDAQPIGAADPRAPDPSPKALRCRDLAQSIAQWIGPASPKRITVFISHTKRSAQAEEGIGPLIDEVRNVIARTRLSAFFDAQDLQPGDNWNEALRRNAATSAMLAIRTDLYATRDWCQREILIAKNAGAPVVLLDALDRGETRGSFLMDHAPRIPVRRSGGTVDRTDIQRALDLLVDKCLERAVWLAQGRLATETTTLGIDWWAPQAPEPVTLIEWLTAQDTQHGAGTARETLTVLHPDPPLGEEEKASLAKIVRATGTFRSLDLVTPRSLAARYDPTRPSSSPLHSTQSLTGKRLALSVSESTDLERLGFMEDHFRLALAEIGRAILVSGGSLAYGGHLRRDGYTVFLIDELEKYCPSNRPIQVCLAWTVHQELTDEAWNDAMMDMGITAEAVFLDIEGNPVRRGGGNPPTDATDVAARSLTAMRRYMADAFDGRVLLGGKRRDFMGAMPGIVEEAILTVEARKPLYLAGGFGGATLDLAQCLDDRCAAFCPPEATVTPDDARTISALAQFRSHVRDDGWKALRNGLSADENLRLAVTHRPSEIAELVCLGLGRLQSESQ